jgi:hypothetical protein
MPTDDLLQAHSDLEFLARHEWLRNNEPRLAKLSEAQRQDLRSIALRFGINDASRILKRLLQKKSPGPKPIAQKIINGVVATVYEPSVSELERRRVNTLTVGELISLDSVLGVDEDGHEVRLADVLPYYM